MFILLLPRALPLAVLVPLNPCLALAVSHLVNANKKLKTPLTSKDTSHLGKLYMTLFERLEPQSESKTMAASQR